MKRNHRTQGAVAKRHGAEFEARLKEYFNLQKNLGICDIRKQNEALKPVRSNGKGGFFSVYTEPSGCDYFGTMENGISIVLEAKHRDSDRLSQSDLTEIQHEHLLNVAKLKGLAVVIVEFSDRKVFALPYLLLLNSKEIFGFKHIKESELKGFEFNFDNPMNKNLYSIYEASHLYFKNKENV